MEQEHAVITLENYDKFKKLDSENSSLKAEIITLENEKRRLSTFIAKLLRGGGNSDINPNFVENLLTDFDLSIEIMGRKIGHGKDTIQ